MKTTELKPTKNVSPAPVGSGAWLALRSRVVANDEWLRKSENLHRDEKKRIGAYARYLRECLGLSLREVARRMDVSAPHLSDLEKGNRNWTADMLTAWESALANSRISRTKK